MSVLALPARVTVTLAIGIVLALVSAQHWDSIRERTHPIEFADLDELWSGAVRVLDDSGPLYDDPDSIRAGIATVVYPPPIVEALIPLTPLGYPTGSLIFTLAQVACVGVLLWAIRVVDWRCWALTAFSIPITDSLAWGNPAILAATGLALLWRWKDDVTRGALAYALAVCVKLMLLPLAFWMASTRRLPLAVRSIAATALLILVGWAAIGFEGLSSYPHLLAHDGANYANQGSLVNGLFHQLGASRELATGAASVSAAALFVLAYVMRGRDHACFSLTVLGCMVLSPLAAPYYFSFLIVVIGARWQQLAWPWAVVPMLWFPLGELAIGVERSVVCIALVGVLVAAVVRGADSATSPGPTVTRFVPRSSQD